MREEKKEKKSGKTENDYCARFSDTIYAFTYDRGIVYLGRNEITHREFCDVEFECSWGSFHTHFFKSKDAVAFLEPEELFIEIDDLCKLVMGTPKTNRTKRIYQIIDKIVPMDGVRNFRVIRHKDGLLVPKHKKDLLIEVTNDGVYEMYVDGNDE